MLIVWGGDRDQAIRRLGRALSELRIEGIETAVPLYQALLADPDFLAGRLDIGMLDRKLEAGELAPVRAPELDDLPVIAAALEYVESQGRQSAAPAGGGRRSGWGAAGRLEGVGRPGWR